MSGSEYTKWVEWNKDANTDRAELLRHRVEGKYATLDFTYLGETLRINGPIIYSHSTCSGEVWEIGGHGLLEDNVESIHFLMQFALPNWARTPLIENDCRLIGTRRGAIYRPHPDSEVGLPVTRWQRHAPSPVFEWTTEGLVESDLEPRLICTRFGDWVEDE